MSRPLAKFEDNIVPFQPRVNLKLQRLNQLSAEVEQESHLFIVILGTVIGAILALFIGYHLNNSAIHFLLLITIPVVLAYTLRRVYIYTLLQNYH
ncbi:hypothetical protein A3K93_08765 [Acinetobacter sp. NCu2D-2]|uniref:hypothetical protein n=1 Tax=Acinetobacter sp. NCu2D-2 TaxID=1608473 RepID=UPI0007CDC27D|nr:hypothetical protein [Acinetobacter sp. NCu2D-2]ANF82274.1 hypothetical protein A3K93_08765 [Acinetobacter sp. NCu2D-2]